MSEARTSSEVTGKPQADIMEVELTSEDLSPGQAAARQAAGSSTHAATRCNVRRPVVRITGALAALFALIGLRSIAQYEGLVRIQPRPMAAAAWVPVPQLRPEPAPQPSPPVRMANPFDSSEVFEFPPGTSRAEAQESVANLLMQRARDRRPPPGVVRRKARQPVSGDTRAS